MVAPEGSFPTGARARPDCAKSYCATARNRADRCAPPNHAGSGIAAGDEWTRPTAQPDKASGRPTSLSETCAMTAVGSKHRQTSTGTGGRIVRRHQPAAESRGLRGPASTTHVRACKGSPGALQECSRASRVDSEVWTVRKVWRFFAKIQLTCARIRHIRRVARATGAARSQNAVLYALPV